MSTRFKEYQTRVHYKGDSKRAYVKKKVEESIDSLIQDSQYGFDIDIYNKETKDYVNYEVAILSTKTTQEYEAANIIARIGAGLEKGTLFKWQGNDWLILKQMFRPDQPGFNGIAYRCTGYLKWIDEKTNELHVQPAYIRSGRITNALGVTPDVNRVYDNIVMHDTDWNMMAATQQNLALHPEMRFIIKGQAYRVTNVDNVSIDNVSILSFTDDKLLDSDDIINGIAYSDEYSYKISCSIKDKVCLYAGDISQLPVTILRDGVQVDEPYHLISSDPAIVEAEGTALIGRGIGTATITVVLDRNDTITSTILVDVSTDHTPQEVEVFIEGDDYIEWNTTQTYRLSNGADAAFEVECLSKISKDIVIDNDKVTISIKDKYSGTFIIIAKTDKGDIEKTVYIRTV